MKNSVLCMFVESVVETALNEALEHLLGHQRDFKATKRLAYMNFIYPGKQLQAELTTSTFSVNSPCLRRTCFDELDLNKPSPGSGIISSSTDRHNTSGHNGPHNTGDTPKCESVIRCSSLSSNDSTVSEGKGNEFPALKCETELLDDNLQSEHLELEKSNYKFLGSDSPNSSTNNVKSRSRIPIMKKTIVGDKLKNTDTQNGDLYGTSKTCKSKFMISSTPIKSNSSLPDLTDPFTNLAFLESSINSQPHKSVENTTESASLQKSALRKQSIESQTKSKNITVIPGCELGHFTKFEEGELDNTSVWYPPEQHTVGRDESLPNTTANVRPSTLNISDLGTPLSDTIQFSPSGSLERVKQDSLHYLKQKHAKQIEDLQSYYETRVKCLQEEISEFRKEIFGNSPRSSVTHLKYLEQINDELNFRCQQYENRNHSLQQEIEKWTKNYFQLEKAYRMLEAEKEVAVGKCSRVMQEKGKSDSEMSKMQTMLNDTLRERRETDDLLLALQRKEIELNSKLKEAETAITELQLALEEVQMQCSIKEDRIVELEEQRGDLQQSLSQAVNKIDELQDSISKKYRDQDIFQKLLQEYEALYKQHQRIKGLYKDTIDNMGKNTTEMEALRSSMTKLEDECTRLREEKESTTLSRIPVRQGQDSLPRRKWSKQEQNVRMDTKPISDSLSDNDFHGNQTYFASDDVITTRPFYSSANEIDKLSERCLMSPSFATDRDERSLSQHNLSDSGMGYSGSNMGHSINRDRQSEMLTREVPFGRADDEPMKGKGPKKALLSKFNEMRNISNVEKRQQSPYSASPSIRRQKAKSWHIEHPHNDITRFDVVFDNYLHEEDLKNNNYERAEREEDALKEPESADGTEAILDAVRHGKLTTNPNDKKRIRIKRAKSEDRRLWSQEDGKESELTPGKIEERIFKITSLEQEFKRLSDERNQIESRLSKIPSKASGKIAKQKKEQQEMLEERLEDVVKRIGAVKMTLRQYNAL